MKTVLANFRRYLLILMALGVVSWSGCSKKSDSAKTDNTIPENINTNEASSSKTESTTQSVTPRNAPGATAAPPEMALVVQDFGMAKFSELKRLNDLGYALFSVYSDGTVTSRTSASLADYQIDWSAARSNRYGAADFSLLTPPLKNLSTGQAIAPQQITISRSPEDKLTLQAPGSFFEVITIETLVSDSVRTICALGISTP